MRGKRLIAMILALTVALLCSTGAGAVTIYDYGSWSFTYNDDGTYEVYSCALTSAEITVPAYVDWYEVRSIRREVFRGNEGLTSVTLKEPLTTIGEYAFADCPSLQTVVIPDSVSSIADSAFERSEAVTIYCTSGSYALQYAKEHDIPYIMTDVPHYILGDTDQDGSVSIIDSVIIQRYLVKMKLDDPEAVVRNGDIDGDGLNIVDAIWIQRWIAKMEIPYAVGETVYITPSVPVDEYEAPIIS